jgi:hypothetical protein
MKKIMIVDWIIQKIPEANLSQALWWLSFSALALPAVLGYTAMRVNDRIGDIATAKAKANEVTSNRRVQTLEAELQASKDLAEGAYSLASSVETKSKFRAIVGEQFTSLKSSLNGMPSGRVVIDVIESDVEAVAFAESIQKLLEAVGNEVTVEKQIAISPAPIGLVMRARELNMPKHAESILSEFQAKGIDVKGMANPAIVDDVLRIEVGAKPAPK